MVRTTSSTLSHLRSFLFAPGDDERKIEKALAGEADAVVADLEDAVAPERKVLAREVVGRASQRSRRPALLVRINAPDTPFAGDDLAALVEMAIDGVVVPKATRERIEALGDEGPSLLALIETAEGVRGAYETASAARVVRLALGAADLGIDLGLVPTTGGEELLFTRSKLVVDSAAAKVAPPVDGVHLELRDPAGLERDAQLVRSLGFRGKLCIHPAQVGVVNDAFSPSRTEVAAAKRVIEAFDEAVRLGLGVVQVDGAMVDAPVVERARAVLQEAERGGRS
jgi:citrate lyase beta subunit